LTFYFQYAIFAAMNLSHPDKYKTGLRVVFLVKRNKDGDGEPIQAADRRTVFVTDGVEAHDKLINYLYPNMKEGTRIYSSLDERRLDKAILEFKNMQLAADESEVQQRVFYDSTTRAWHRSLMQARARKTKLFLFDCDDAEQAERASNALRFYDIKSLHDYPTKNGHHFITQPFNTGPLPRDIQKIAQRNAMLLWAWK
jgi:hypothetical protein